MRYETCVKLLDLINQYGHQQFLYGDATHLTPVHTAKYKVKAEEILEKIETILNQEQE